MARSEVTFLPSITTQTITSRIPIRRVQVNNVAAATLTLTDAGGTLLETMQGGEFIARNCYTTALNFVWNAASTTLVRVVYWDEEGQEYVAYNPTPH